MLTRRKLIKGVALAFGATIVGSVAVDSCGTAAVKPLNTSEPVGPEPKGAVLFIGDQCINCGACEPECPNTAIYEGGVPWEDAGGSMHGAISTGIYYIVPEKCSKCVGFFNYEQCAAVCPVDCCLPDSADLHSEAALLERARRLHPKMNIPSLESLPPDKSCFRSRDSIYQCKV